MKYENVFEQFEHIGIYVVDQETMVTYYENAIAEKFSGRCRIGEPCYKVHGNTAMCSSCPIRDKDHISLVNRGDHNMIFEVRCEETVWEGHPAYLIMVSKQPNVSYCLEEEKSLNRMSRALEKSVNVYTEINIDTMEYHQINLLDSEGLNVANIGDYTQVFEQMCREEIHPEDVAEARKVLNPENLKKISLESEGAKEVSVRYRLKNVSPTRIMESRAIFMRDELPHYVVCLARDVTEESLLRNQASSLENILNQVSCGVAIFRMDEAGGVYLEYVNDGMCNLVEYTKEFIEEKNKKDVLSFIDPSYKDLFINSFQELFEGKKNTEITFQLTTSKKTTKWIKASFSVALNEKGLARVYGTFVDVSANVESQRETQEKYEVEKRRSQDDASILAYAVFDLKNLSTIEMERRKPLEALNKKLSFPDFFSDIEKVIISDRKKKDFHEMFDVSEIEKKHKEGVDEQSIEYQRKLSNGNIIWVRSTVHLIYDAGRNRTLLFYYCNDINQSKCIELMTSYMVNEDYDLMGYVNFETDTAIMLYGANSIRKFQNNQRIYREEKYSESVEWFANHSVVPEERETYKNQTQLQEIKQTLLKQPYFELTIHVQDGKNQIRAKKIRYTRYQPDLNVCFFSQIDITDMLSIEEEKQKKLQEALEAAKQANEAKTSFLSRMSHDMRTPMNGVLGLASLMRDETNLEEIAKDIDQLEMSGKYLLQLINDTLDVNKIEAGKLELRLQPIDSEKVFYNILTNATIFAREKGVELVVDRPDIKHGEWVEVLADASRLEQVLMNIISNAIKFTKKGGTVKIKMETVSITEEEVIDRYTICDTGIGMSEDFLNHIFEPFAQEGRLNTNRESGTGLGMSIVKQLVELMGGSISIKSKLNEGTQVTIQMHYPVSHRAQRREPRDKIDLSILKNKRILLCEDHPLNAQIAIRLLKKMQIKVEHAENGEKGIQMFVASNTGYFDMILMDIRMPKMNGLEATKEIRSLNRKDAKIIPIIAMTANAFEDDVKACLAIGMNGHIAKPINPQIMFETIAKNMK